MSSPASPMPTATITECLSRGNTSVCPVLPSKPIAVSASRSAPSCLGTAPLVPTATPMAPTPSGTPTATLTLIRPASTSDGAGWTPAREFDFLAILALLGKKAQRDPRARTDATLRVARRRTA